MIDSLVNDPFRVSAMDCLFGKREIDSKGESRERDVGGCVVERRHCPKLRTTVLLCVCGLVNVVSGNFQGSLSGRVCGRMYISTYVHKMHNNTKKVKIYDPGVGTYGSMYIREPM